MIKKDTKRAVAPSMLGVLLATTIIGVAQEGSSHRNYIAPTDTPTEVSCEKPQSTTLGCLPPTVKLDDVVAYGLKTSHNRSVKDKLFELKAHCKGQNLVDVNDREIRFYRLHCWGNSPPDYQEIRKKERNDLRELQKRYTVVLTGCNAGVL